MTPEAIEQIRQAEEEMAAESAVITVTDHYIQRSDGTISRIRTSGSLVLEYEPDAAVLVLPPMDAA